MSEPTENLLVFETEITLVELQQRVLANVGVPIDLTMVNILREKGIAFGPDPSGQSPFDIPLGEFTCEPDMDKQLVKYRQVLPVKSVN